MKSNMKHMEQIAQSVNQSVSYPSGFQFTVNRSEVMRLEAMIVNEVEHETHGADSTSNECPFALKFKVSSPVCKRSQVRLLLGELKIFPSSFTASVTD